MELITAVIAGLLLFPAHYIYRIWRNYAAARATGLPAFAIPASLTNPAWFLLSVPTHAFLSRLGLSSVLRFGYLGWEFEEKARPFLELGSSAILLAGPDRCWLSLADADATAALFAAERRGEFTRLRDGIKMLEVFGPNVSTVESPADWARMRKATAASFNEATNKVVWAETLRQGRGMVSSWVASGSAGVRSTAEDTRTLALNIMLRAGFGKSYGFETAGKKGKAKGGMDYRTAISLVLENAMLIIGIGPKTVPRLGSVFGKLATLGTAIATFKQYMTDMLDEESRKSSGESAGGRNLLESLVRASRVENLLSQEEVFGNMFVYTFGGHDTTAHSQAFTILLLSIHPEVQEWVREEIRTMLKSDDPEEWSYDEFGKLKRTLAVQLETLRLYNPLLGIVKGPTSGAPFDVTLEGGKRSVPLPAKTIIVFNTNAIHSHPRYWGDDALEWNPFRWIKKDKNGVEELVVPARGVYEAWGEGLRSCPGRKFGQVEHVALMACTLRDHSVTAAKEPGETVQQTRERIMGVISESEMVLNIQLKHPEKAKLIWKPCP